MKVKDWIVELQKLDPEEELYDYHVDVNAVGIATPTFELMTVTMQKMWTGDKALCPSQNEYGKRVLVLVLDR